MLDKGALNELVALERAEGYFVESPGDDNLELRSSGNDIQAPQMEGHDHMSQGRG